MTSVLFTTWLIPWKWGRFVEALGFHLRWPAFYSKLPIDVGWLSMLKVYELFALTKRHSKCEGMTSTFKSFHKKDCKRVISINGTSNKPWNWRVLREYPGTSGCSTELCGEEPSRPSRRHDVIAGYADICSSWPGIVQASIMAWLFVTVM